MPWKPPSKSQKGWRKNPSRRSEKLLLDELMEEMTGQMQGSSDEADAQESAPPETPAP